MNRITFKHRVLSRVCPSQSCSRDIVVHGGAGHPAISGAQDAAPRPSTRPPKQPVISGRGADSLTQIQWEGEPTPPANAPEHGLCPRHPAHTGPRCSRSTGTLGLTAHGMNSLSVGPSPLLCLPPSSPPPPGPLLMSSRSWTVPSDGSPRARWGLGPAWHWVLLGSGCTPAL